MSEKLHAELAKALRNCADSLEAEINARYGFPTLAPLIEEHHPTMRRYKQDMQDVVDARAALEKAGWS